MARWVIWLAFLFALLDASTVRAEPIALPALRNAGPIWGDGQDLLYVAHSVGKLTLHECRRGTELHRIEPPDWNLEVNVRMVGNGSGADAQLVLWDQRGRAAWYSGGKWTLTQLPLPPEKNELNCRGVLPAIGALFSCVNVDGAVVQWQGDATRYFEPPPGQRTILSVTATSTGTLYFVEKEPHLWRFENGRYTQLPLPKLHRENSQEQYDNAGVYLDPSSEELWVGFADRLLIWDLKSGRSRLRRLPDPLLDQKYEIGWHAMRGVRAKNDTVIWAGSFKHQFLCDRTDCYRVQVPSYLHSGFLFPNEGIFYAALDTGMTAVPVQATALGNGVGQPVRESESRHSPKLLLPFLNLAMGPRWPLPTADVAFALDLSIGVHLGWTRNGRPTSAGFWLSPLLAYSHTSDTDLFVVGTGLGFGSRRFAIDYIPRMVIGSGPAGTVIGGRHGIAFHLINGLVGVEVAHQYSGEHDVRLMFYLNPGLLIVGGLALSVLRPFVPTSDLF